MYIILRLNITYIVLVLFYFLYRFLSMFSISFHRAAWHSKTRASTSVTLEKQMKTVTEKVWLGNPLVTLSQTPIGWHMMG